MPTEIIPLPQHIRREVVGSLRKMFDSSSALFESNSNQDSQEVCLFRSHATASDILLPELRADKSFSIVILGDYASRAKEMLIHYLQRNGFPVA